MERSPVCVLTELMLSLEEAKSLTIPKIAGAISKIIREQNKARAAKLR